ncbi:MAG TPA: VOC family protein [Thermoanaerobaculia bacterium]|nr:VOC family protein [Thermoanaerobaculia bacterium]
MLNQIGQIAINTHDIERATAFYRDVLGMRHLFQAGPKLSFFDCGGIRLMLSLPEDGFDHPGSILYYKVDDIRAAYESIRGRGAEFVGEPHLVAKMPDHELWMAFLKDSEGNTLALMSEVR